MSLLFPAGYVFLNSNARAVASGTVTFYETGTATEKAIYSDIDLQTVAANPYPLDAAGRIGVNIYGEDGQYTVLVKDSAGATIFSRDEVIGWNQVEGFGVNEFTATILPAADNTLNLGSASFAFANVFSEIVRLGISGIYHGTGSPESAVTAEIGSLYLRTNGSTGTAVYVKQSGSGNTGWTALDTGLTGSATYNPGELLDAAGETTTVTVTGAALGDYAQASFSLDLQGITLSAWVSAADTVSVRFQNESGGTLNLASGTLRARVIRA